MKNLALSTISLSILLFCAQGAIASPTWKEDVVYSFPGAPDGSAPAGGAVFDDQGNLYVVSVGGGSQSCAPIANECGAVYELSPPAKKGDPWTSVLIRLFKGKESNDPSLPTSGLIIDSFGNLYGVTGFGGRGNCALKGIAVGCGTVYELSPPKHKGGDWTETILYSFPSSRQGYLPSGDLVFDAAGNLYGSTQFGGGRGTICDPSYQYCGAVFELSPPKKKGGKWTEKVLHGFRGGTDGAAPNGGLVLDTEGALYGTSFAGGNHNCNDFAFLGCGVAFKLEPPARTGGGWTETILHRFNFSKTDGSNPMAGFVVDSKGNLYGTTVGGGSGPGGTVFRLSPPSRKSRIWTETILHAFNGDNGGNDPQGALVFAKNGDLYGTTNSGNTFSGAVFRLSAPPQGSGKWAFTVLHDFSGPPDGAQPAASMTMDNLGNLYSTTQNGGTGSCFYGCGTVFEVLH